MHVLGEVKDTLFFYNTRKIMTTGGHLTTFPAPDRNIRRPQNQIDCPPIRLKGLAGFATVFPTGPADHRGHTESTQTAHKQHIGSTKG